jgi:hypothetical protein
MRIKRSLMVALVLMVFLAGCNRRPEGGIGSGTGGWPPNSQSSPAAEVSSSAQVVKVSASKVDLAPNGSADATITLSISSGYHVNANPATYPYLIATEISTTKVEGITAGKPVYPSARKQQFEFAEEPLAVYEGETQISLTLRADPKTQPGSRSLPVSVKVQACDHEKCFPPSKIDATIPVEVN